MYGSGREKKTKVTKRSKQAAAAAAAEADGAVQSNKRDTWLKKDSEDDNPSRRGAAWQPPRGEDGSLGEQVFIRWDEVLGSREAFKRRLDTIAVVHGWESRSARKSFLGGIEPGTLVHSLAAEVQSLDASATELERADLLLQLQQVRRQLDALEQERERSAEDVAQLQEDNFEARLLPELPTYGMRTACPLHVHCMSTACPLHGHCMYCMLCAPAGACAARRPVRRAQRPPRAGSAGRRRRQRRRWRWRW